MKKIFAISFFIIFSSLLIFTIKVNAQTEQDAIMMNKNQLCFGAVYVYQNWDEYWEGKFKRSNENLGTVSTTSYNVMATYGLKNNLNVLLNVPYVKTKASMGTLHSMEGVQDASLWLKWMFYNKTKGNNSVSLYALAGLTTPLSNYTPDFMPLSIGNHATTLSARIMADYEIGKFFITGSGTYQRRNNIKIDRNSYYTTELHLTNEVFMPDAVLFNVRTGYRSQELICEAFISQYNTIGGFDIRKNDMPFPSNKVVTTNLGAAFKYSIPKNYKLAFVGSLSKVVEGRNAGQTIASSGGVLYAINTKK